MLKKLYDYVMLGSVCLFVFFFFFLGPEMALPAFAYYVTMLAPVLRRLELNCDLLDTPTQRWGLVVLDLRRLELNCDLLGTPSHPLKGGAW